MNRPGIEFLSVPGMPPVEFVEPAADLGCGSISTGLMQMPFNPLGFPEWSLLDLLEMQPRDRVVSLEVPRLARAGSQAQLQDHLGECVEGACSLLQRVP